jgi:hypothetical protein
MAITKITTVQRVEVYTDDLVYDDLFDDPLVQTIAAAVWAE